MISAPKDVFGPNVFRLFVDEIGRKRVCQMLDISKVTLGRWLRDEYPVPKMAVMALYWETSYGKSMVNTDQVNEIRLLYRRVCILQEQFQKAKDIVTGLRRLHSGTANEAFFDELPEFRELPLDTYGSFPNESQHKDDALEHQANPTPSRLTMPKPSGGAKAAAAAFDDLRRVAAR